MEAIYAIDSKNGLCKEGKIPWYSKKDLKFFMNVTKNNVVIMGKNTYLSLPNGALKERLNIILTSHAPNCLYDNDNDNDTKNYFITSNDKIYEYILHNRDKYIQIYPFLHYNFTIFFIGGKQIYQQFIPLCERVWVTQIKKNYMCDLFFNFDYSKQYKEVLIEEDDELKITKYEKKHTYC
jgi:dihydrofolate reductase